MLIFSVIIVLILITSSSLLSALETAFIAASLGKIEKQRKASPAKTRMLAKLLKNKDRVISTILIIYSIVNTVATTIATSTIIEIFGDEYGTVIASTIMSVLIIIFAEVIPKAIAVSNAEAIALNGVSFTNAALVIMKPINHSLHLFLRFFCFIFRIDLTTEISAADEVRGVIEHYHLEGNVKKYDRDMLGGILDLRHITVEAVMVHRSQIMSINIDQSPEDIINQALNTPHTRIPLWQGTKDNIIGILHVRNILKALHRNKYNFSKLDIKSYTSEPWFVPENAPLSKQLMEFKDRKSHMAIVVDEYGDIIGILTLEDILEEVVGQIDDELDVAPSKIIKKSKFNYIVDGTASIRDINRELSLKLSSENANTIAGLFMHNLERLPNVGDRIELSSARLTIVKKHFNRIKQVLIEIKPSEDNLNVS
ncbi:MAG: CNNM domain-containing protein [Rickettsiaceae bacterium]|nr:CNNM domain-containing protein [Rickettsiaceae bacterium]